MKDKYSAIWLSYSSISDYLKCPRAYYLKNIYRDPKTNHKITLMQPALALGQTVHDVIDAISLLPVEKRLEIPLTETLEEKWKSITGKMGGFRDIQEEELYKKRGRSMVKRIMDNPGPVLKKAIKLRDSLSWYWLSEDDNLILCGKIDWLEYLEKEDAIRIIDFKTVKFDEDPNSLQLPIYFLLCVNVQKRGISGVQYWYLDKDNEPIDMPLPLYGESEKRLLEIGKRIALARKLDRFVCNHKDGCPVCRPMERILENKAEFVRVNDYNQDVYIL
ncbi:PD-(D/E)XK nuclease family protein [Patescibacteria group bacterium]|nr:PD-(D/E)XK nuclease family protein [Patescibacteria group bacterium]